MQGNSEVKHNMALQRCSLCRKRKKTTDFKPVTSTADGQTKKICHKANGIYKQPHETSSILFSSIE